MGADHHQIIQRLADKSVMKYKIYDYTFEVFNQIKDVFEIMSNETREELKILGADIPVEYKERGEFEVEMKAAGDMLIATMHTNVFEFPKAHIIQQTKYIKDDPSRSYCGMISIYNFLADSFKYNRVNDVGYLVGRIFVNKEKHFFLEGKRQLGLMYNDFATTIITPEIIREIMEAALLLSIDFDLLVPPFDAVKEISVQEMNFLTSSISLKTGKSLGFRFETNKEAPH